MKKLEYKPSVAKGLFDNKIHLSSIGNGASVGLCGEAIENNLVDESAKVDCVICLRIIKHCCQYKQSATGGKFTKGSFDSFLDRICKITMQEAQRKFSFDEWRPTQRIQVSNGITYDKDFFELEIIDGQWHLFPKRGIKVNIYWDNIKNQDGEFYRIYAVLYRDNIRYFRLILSEPNVLEEIGLHQIEDIELMDFIEKMDRAN